MLSVTSFSPNMMCSSFVTVTRRRASFTGVEAACTSGKLMRRPVVSSGAVTMNTTSSTSITSTKGVMLMSRKPPRFPLRPTEAPMSAHARLGDCGHAARSLFGDQRGDVHVARCVQLVEQVGDALVDVVVADGGRDGGDQADGGGDERFTDGGCNDRERGALLHADAQEGNHDAPNGAEKADERR